MLVVARLLQRLWSEERGWSEDMGHAILVLIALVIFLFFAAWYGLAWLVGGSD